MFRKRKSKNDAQAANALTNLGEIGRAGDVSIHERVEHGGAHGPPPNGHGMGEADGELEDDELDGDAPADREFTEELRDLLDEETGEIDEGERAFNVAGNTEVHPAAADKVVEKVNSIWHQRLEVDPEGALDDVRAKVNQLGYRLACAGRTYGAPIAKRTYHIVQPDRCERVDVFRSGDTDLTLLDVCLWSELAFKKWTNS